MTKFEAATLPVRTGTIASFDEAEGRGLVTFEGGDKARISRTLIERFGHTRAVVLGTMVTGRIARQGECLEIVVINELRLPKRRA